MRLHRLAFLCIGIATVAAPPAGAQATLRNGTWTGSSVSNGGEEVRLSFEVRTSGDTISIVVAVPEQGSLPFTGIRLANDTLWFTIQPGARESVRRVDDTTRVSFEPSPDVNCVLLRQADGSFAGNCIVGDTGESAALRMVPPTQ
ncbi:MAG TPA: hypothetical protein VGP80_12395 [Gemmatimonadales bacterium]|jgi:hypothetical protein|nr:hypothetical protein [Gemmatimonadales bacterium]